VTHIWPTHMPIGKPARSGERAANAWTGGDGGQTSGKHGKHPVAGDEATDNASCAWMSVGKKTAVA
jgi:hypothetical protein